MLNARLLLILFGILTVNGFEKREISNLWMRFGDENYAGENEKSSTVTAKIGTNLTIPCRMDYKLTYFAWFFCESDCGSSKPQWKMVVKVDNGSIDLLYPEKFGFDNDGALIMKDLQPSNNDNRARCYYRERLVKRDHRTIIIHIAKESPTITLKSIKNHVVFKNMPLFLECAAKGYPVPWVAWMKDNKVLQNHTDGSKYLLRRHVTKKEAGTYTCMAGNAAGNTTYPYHVTVKDDGPTSGSNAPPGPYSTGKRSTEGSKGTSKASPTDPTKGQEASSSLVPGLAVGIPLAFIAGIAFGAVLMRYCIRRQKKRGLVVRVAFDEPDLSSSSEGEDGI